MASHCGSPSHNDLFALMAARRGHFRLESGHHGDLWLDVDRVFQRPARLTPFVVELAKRLAAHRVEVVCGPLTGGAFLAELVAVELDVDFVYANRRASPSAGDLFPVEYQIPDALADIVAGKRVAVVNDVINAGSAVRGALADLQNRNARTVAIGALLLLGNAPMELAHSAGIPLESLAEAPNQLWTLASCPLCKSGVPLENLVD